MRARAIPEGFRVFVSLDGRAVCDFTSASFMEDFMEFYLWLQRLDYGALSIYPAATKRIILRRLSRILYIYCCCDTLGESRIV